MVQVAPERRTERTISVDESANDLAAVLARVAAGGEAVILAREGRPTAVIVPIAEYHELVELRRRDEQRREAALAELRRLGEQFGNLNDDLTDAQVEEMANRFSHEMIDDLAAEGALRFERGRPERSLRGSCES